MLTGRNLLGLIAGQEVLHRVGEFTFAETEKEMPGFLTDLLEMPGNASKAMGTEDGLQLSSQKTKYPSPFTRWPFDRRTPLVVVTRRELWDFLLCADDILPLRAMSRGERYVLGLRI
jgi:hypothetical protein